MALAGLGALGRRLGVGALKHERPISEAPLVRAQLGDGDLHGRGASDALRDEARVSGRGHGEDTGHGVSRALVGLADALEREHVQALATNHAREGLLRHTTGRREVELRVLAHDALVVGHQVEGRKRLAVLVTEVDTGVSGLHRKDKTRQRGVRPQVTVSHDHLTVGHSGSREVLLHGRGVGRRNEAEVQRALTSDGPRIRGHAAGTAERQEGVRLEAAQDVGAECRHHDKIGVRGTEIGGRLEVRIGGGNSSHLTATRGNLECDVISGTTEAERGGVSNVSCVQGSGVVTRRVVHIDLDALLKRAHATFDDEGVAGQAGKGEALSRATERDPVEAANLTLALLLHLEALLLGISVSAVADLRRVTHALVVLAQDLADIASDALDGHTTDGEGHLRQKRANGLPTRTVLVRVATSRAGDAERRLILDEQEGAGVVVLTADLHSLRARGAVEGDGVRQLRLLFRGVDIRLAEGVAGLGLGEVRRLNSHAARTHDKRV